MFVANGTQGMRVYRPQERPSSELNFHSEDQCRDQGYPCCVHSPSDHPLRGKPLVLRIDLTVPLMERLCNCGFRHPDPDSVAYLLRVRGQDYSVHTCLCRCCRPATPFFNDEAVRAMNEAGTIAAARAGHITFNWPEPLEAMRVTPNQPPESWWRVDEEEEPMDPPF